LLLKIYKYFFLNFNKLYYYNLLYRKFIYFYLLILLINIKINKKKDLK